MSRKARRTTVARGETPPVPAQPLPRYRPLARPVVTQADFTDEAQYVHVRGDLLRIGILAASLFGGLLLLWLLWPLIEPQGARVYGLLLPWLHSIGFR